ncbi:ferredoxin [Streptomyces albus subsp. albus]|nr:ferredoxin [Streptomyces albus subsp. albus]
MGDEWEVEVDRGICVGSGMCAHAAPEAFRLDATRRSRPARPRTPGSEAVLAAAEGCPVEAITLRLTPTGEPVFPPEE